MYNLSLIFLCKSVIESDARLQSLNTEGLLRSDKRIEVEELPFGSYMP